MQYALVYLPGIVVGRLCDLGYFNHTLCISRSANVIPPIELSPPDSRPDFSTILVVAVVLTAECKEFWQLLLCQGLLTGVCCGMIFCPIPAVVSQWFLKRRSLVFGIISTGSSLGGTIIPIAVRNLIELIGYTAYHGRAVIIAHESLQVQMDDACCRSGRALHAYDWDRGEDFRASFSRRSLMGPPPDPQAKDRAPYTGQTLLRLARFQKACVQRAYP